MPRMTVLMKMVSIPLVLTALFACSNSNDSASAVIDGAGRHVVGAGYVNWVQQHWVEYRKLNGGSSAVSGNTSCSECHGVDLAGGAVRVSCFSPSFSLDGVNLSCHANGDHTLGHPSSWIDPASGTGFHAASTFNGSVVRGSTTLAQACGLCHATAANGVSIDSAPSCLSTDPSFGIACHVTSPAVTSSGCTSCHGGPPNGPSGAAAPNRAGAHAAHLALGVGCRACHRGAGTGTDKHAVGVGLAFLNLSTGLQAQTGSFAYAGGRCSGVACHGGQQSPNWRTGETIDVAQDCTSCHEPLNQALPQYNAYFSGFKFGENLHLFHLNGPDGFTITCTTCHNPDLLTSHFVGLATPAFEGVAATTLASFVNYEPATGACTVSCHFDVNGNNPDPNKVIFLWK